MSRLPFPLCHTWKGLGCQNHMRPTGLWLQVFWPRPQGGAVAPSSEVLSKAEFLSPGEESGDQLASSL